MLAAWYILGVTFKYAGGQIELKNRKDFQGEEGARDSSSP